MRPGAVARVDRNGLLYPVSDGLQTGNEVRVDANYLEFNPHF